MTLTTVLSAIFTALGASLLLYAAFIWLRARASCRWPSTAAVLDTARVQDSVGYTRGGSYPTYALALRYSYTVGGKVYHGSRRGFGRTDYRSMEEAAAALRALTGQPEVRIYYDPGNPARAVLEPGAGPGVYQMAAVSAAILGAGLIIAQGP